MPDNYKEAYAEEMELNESLRDKIVKLQRDLKDCRNELCLRCGQYKTAHLGSCNGCRWNGNYEPSNCRWTNRKVQMNNRRVNVLLTYNGETKTLAQWADALGICYSTITSRYCRGWSIERIANTPVRAYGKESA